MRKNWYITANQPYRTRFMGQQQEIERKVEGVHLIFGGNKTKPQNSKRPLLPTSRHPNGHLTIAVKISWGCFRFPKCCIFCPLLEISCTACGSGISATLFASAKLQIQMLMRFIWLYLYAWWYAVLLLTVSMGLEHDKLLMNLGKVHILLL